MVLNLIARSILQPIAACRANRVSAVTGALSANIQGAFDVNQVNPWSLVNYTQYRGAARRGKRIQRAREARERASKRRIAEAQNPRKKQNKRSLKIDKSQFRFQTERELDLTLPPTPSDNVYFMDKYKKRRFSLEEILEFHRQAVHPDVLNKPNALVSATIELNLKMKLKKKKYIERIESTVCYPNFFKYEIRSRKIVALCHGEEDREAARQAGAIIVGGLEVVDQLKKAQLTQRDFDHIVCHSNFLVDFANVKGMKGAAFFPSKTRGNFGENIGELVRYFKDGVDYSLKRNPEEPDYGFIEAYFGQLDMTNEQLKDNLIALFNSINRFKPLNLDNGKQFFERVAITTPETEESFLLKFWDLVDDYEDPHAIIEEVEARNT